MNIKLALINIEADITCTICRDITEEVMAEVDALEDADSLAYETANERGVAGGEPPPDGHLNADGPLPDCSMRVAERELAGWKASSAAQVASDWCVHGMLWIESGEKVF